MEDARLVGEARPEPIPNDPARKIAKRRKAAGVRVDFDPDALREFVTGAHRRNVLQRERNIKRAEKAALEARREKRRERTRAARSAREKLRVAGNPFMQMSLPELRREALKARLLDQQGAAEPKEPGELGEPKEPGGLGKPKKLGRPTESELPPVVQSEEEQAPQNLSTDPGRRKNRGTSHHTSDGSDGRPTSASKTLLSLKEYASPSGTTVVTTETF